MNDHDSDELSHAIAEALILARKKRTSWDRLFTIVATIISIVAIIFAAGINWARLLNAESQVHELQVRIERLESNNINQQGDVRVMKNQLDTINQNLVEVKSAIYTSRRGGGPYPVFDPRKK